VRWHDLPAAAEWAVLALWMAGRWWRDHRSHPVDCRAIGRGHLWLLLLLPLAADAGQARFVIDNQPLTDGSISTDTASLCRVASATLDYLERGRGYDPAVIHGGEEWLVGATLERVVDTLRFVCQIEQEDRAAGRQSRLASTQFVERHFERWRWLPDRGDIERRLATASKRLTKSLRAIPADQLLMTRYYVKQIEGRATPDRDHPHALYTLPYDEHGLTLAEAESESQRLVRYRFTKQQVVAGALEGLARPLVWLSRDDLEDVLMQGSARSGSGEGARYFNVHRNNGIAYDYTRARREQGRYWYFKEVGSILGYGLDADEKITIEPRVTFAGDITRLGLGKLLLIEGMERGERVMRLGVMADTGGAFDNNLFQIDLLAGAYRGWSDYQAANRHLPDHVNGWILLLRSDHGTRDQ
jgi:hypothetical protein